MRHPHRQFVFALTLEAASMADGVVKIKLRSGSREIEIEASRSDVDELLAAWWIVTDHGVEEAAAKRDELPIGAPSIIPPDRKPVTRKKTAAKRSNSSAGQSNASAWDPNDLANKIKEHPNFSAVEKKVIHAENDFYNRSAFIISQADEPMSSGQVHKVLEALHVRVGLPRISTALSNNKRHFITSTRG
ncbi:MULTISPECIES: hypothetical protein [Methylobacterium]|uniref:hypothetical protein n=1 Tax=Methylobacterium TaxID=407 RepID=UPI0012E7E1FA|nr:MULTISPECIES: hypothetical protein [Methylobacterium]MCI9882011.1 hypothetical protein [Methylobacterium goesingense]